MFTTLKRLSMARWPWVLLSLCSFGAIGFAYTMGVVLNLPPCAYCITDRYFFFVLGIWSLVPVIAPKNAFLRWVGIIALIVLASRGVYNGYEHLSYVAYAAKNPFATCSATIDWFLIPVNQWFPELFTPFGMCNKLGPDVFGFTLAHTTLALWGVLVLLGVLLGLSQIKFKKDQ